MAVRKISVRSKERKITPAADNFTLDIDSQFRSDSESELEDNLCALHKNQEKKEKANKSKNRPSVKLFFSGLVGKDPLEKKLAEYGLKVKVRRRSIWGNLQNPYESKQLQKDELRLLTTDQLKALIQSMESKITSQDRELSEFNQKNEILLRKQQQLQATSSELEDKIKIVMKPWLNRHPNLYDLTRVLMLN